MNSSAANCLEALSARHPLALLVDDGAVVYLNGLEIFRSNMPSGSIGPTTLALTVVGGADETNFFSTAVAPSALVILTGVPGRRTVFTKPAGSMVASSHQMLPVPPPQTPR